MRTRSRTTCTPIARDVTFAMTKAAAGPRPERTSDLAIARRVVQTEAEGLGVLATAIGPAFQAAADVLAATQGRVIVTGMGKSGHIARKVASTLASTGTPAYFVHAAEASHGDLGMIAPNDTVLAFSNSGETAELSDLLAYVRRFRIPLVAITSIATSTLATTADAAIVLPDVPEACPIGLAPTVSTTLAIAAGDALAAVLLERGGFTAEDFRGLHPGGRLGARLVRVADLMHTGPALPLVDESAPMRETILLMTEKGLGCAGVTGSDGRLTGAVTDGDLRRNMAPDLLERVTRDIMTRNPATIPADALGGEALAKMNERGITSLFVTENGLPSGVLHMHDCLRAGIA